MKKISVFLVKPHPPKEILERACPIPEKYKYNWEPVSLKLIARKLKKNFGVGVNVEIWHLIEPADDKEFLNSVRRKKPDLIAFGEIDVLVNQASALAVEIKKITPETTVIVGGKQSSLLAPGDRFPFEGVDCAIRGDGTIAVSEIVGAMLEGRPFPVTDGMVEVDEKGIVVSETSYSARDQKIDIEDDTPLSSIPVANHEMEEYIGKFQKHPSILEGEVRTAPLLTGTGCPHNCNFCQSPLEYGKAGLRKPVLTDVESVVKEMLFLRRKYRANNFFALEPNLNLDNLLLIYRKLAKRGIGYMPISGFVRAADIVRFQRKGTLERLAAKGLRILSIGLDVSFESGADIFNKAFSYVDMTKCLDICEETGIIALCTVFGNPSSTPEELAGQLEIVNRLPVAEVDVRLGMALRNTKYFKEVEGFLIHHPDKGKEYFDRQNYRYQTIQYPGKITPDESYEIVNRFHDGFLFHPSHVEYVKRFIGKHPDALPFFKRQYSRTQEIYGRLLKNHELKILLASKAKTNAIRETA